MTLQQLRYVIAVSDHPSMSAAANALFLSQPTLSAAIRELEQEIGISIFHRNNKGIMVTVEGKKFLGYARQVVEQAALLEEEYLGGRSGKQKFSISTQHYSFSVKAFVDLIQACGVDTYDFTLRETRTYEIIDDVRSLRSEIGVLYLNSFNRQVLQKFIHESDLVFEEILRARPHVFLCSRHPLAKETEVTLEDLEGYPYLSFEQGDYNSFYFSEEILSTIERKKSIRVSDRATLFNLLIGLNGYTISTGIISEELNGKDILAIPLTADDEMIVGIVTHKDVIRSKWGEVYITALKEHVACYSK